MSQNSYSTVARKPAVTVPISTHQGLADAFVLCVISRGTNSKSNTRPCTFPDTLWISR